jgi:hypothetical protein
MEIEKDVARRSTLLCWWAMRFIGLDDENSVVFFFLLRFSADLLELGAEGTVFEIWM